MTIYAAGANGNAKPIQTITGSNTGIDYPEKLTVDGSGNIYLANTAGVYRRSSVTARPTVTVYAAGANGNARPIQTITGSNTGLVVPIGIAVDADNNIYVSNVPILDPYIPSPIDAVIVYAAGANGNATPIQRISGSNTGLNDPQGVALDGSKNIYVSNTYAASNDFAGSITVYAAGANGNVAPIRTIVGERTKLREPLDIALDTSGNMYVVNNGRNGAFITVYAAGANGNVKPIQTIKGSLTKLNSIYAWAIAVR